MQPLRSDSNLSTSNFRIVRINERLARGQRHTRRVNTSAGRSPRSHRSCGTSWSRFYRRALVGESCDNLVSRRPVPNEPERQRHWLASFFPVRVGDEIVGVGNVVVDVTDRHEADEFRAVVMDNMAEGLYALDAAGA